MTIYNINIQPHYNNTNNDDDDNTNVIMIILTHVLWWHNNNMMPIGTTDSVCNNLTSLSYCCWWQYGNS